MIRPLSNKYDRLPSLDRHRYLTNLPAKFSVCKTYGQRIELAEARMLSTAN